MSKKFHYSTLWNWNGNLLAAVDIKTTGDKAGFHDLVEIAILPLTSDIKIEKKYLPFAPILQPKRPQNYINDLRYKKRVWVANAQVVGLDAYLGGDLLEEWFKKLDLPQNKKIIPLSYDWPAKRAFMIDWLGQRNFEGIFDYRYRDILSTTLFCNDRAEFVSTQIPYPKVDIGYLCSQSKVERTVANDAVADCVVIAEVYRLAIKGSL